MLIMPRRALSEACAQRGVNSLCFPGMIIIQGRATLFALLDNLTPWETPAARTKPLPCRLLLDADAFIVEPLEFTIIIIAPDHFAKARTLTGTVKSIVFLALFLFLFVAGLMAVSAVALTVTRAISLASNDGR